MKILEKTYGSKLDRLITLYIATKKGLIAVLKSKYSVLASDLFYNERFCSPHCPYLSKPYWDPPYSNQDRIEEEHPNMAYKDCLKFSVPLEECSWISETIYVQTFHRCKECQEDTLHVRKLP